MNGWRRIAESVACSLIGFTGNPSLFTRGAFMAKDGDFQLAIDVKALRSISRYAFGTDL